MTMAATIESIGAPSTSNINWETINWSNVELHVNKLQIRIAKAFRERST